MDNNTGRENYGAHLPFTGEWIEHESENSVIEQQKIAVQEPALYSVVLINDDFTPMDFVIMVLEKIFNKTEVEANDIMLQTHNQGEGYCGTFTRDVAETKMTQVIDSARKNGHPLKCILQKQ